MIVKVPHWRKSMGVATLWAKEGHSMFPFFQMIYLALAWIFVEKYEFSKTYFSKEQMNLSKKYACTFNWNAPQMAIMSQLIIIKKYHFHQSISFQCNRHLWKFEMNFQNHVKVSMLQFVRKSLEQRYFLILMVRSSKNENKNHINVSMQAHNRIKDTKYSRESI